MVLGIISNLIYLNSMYNTYKTGETLYYRYRLPINYMYHYARRKYYKY
jgi:hypothetical protein